MRMWHRRNILKAAVSAAVGASLAGPAMGEQSEDAKAVAATKGRIHQSVCRWCYPKWTLAELCTHAKALGLVGIDLLEVDEYAVPAQYGLRCTMGYAGGGEIKQAMNRTENHAAIEAAFRKNIPLAARANVPNVITFSGNRDGMSDAEGARNTIAGLKRVKSIAEDNGVTICMELLNSKVNHPDYMCDHTAWGADVINAVGSPHVKLLYDIYHMQIMEGDLIDTIRANLASGHDTIGHFHTGGVPGRHELNDQQEVQWDGVMRAIADAGYQGYVAHEFLPLGDPVDGLRQAIARCTV